MATFRDWALSAAVLTLWVMGMASYHAKPAAREPALICELRGAI